MTIHLAQRRTIVPTSGKDELWEDIGFKAGTTAAELAEQLLQTGACGQYRTVDGRGISRSEIVRYDGYRIRNL